MDNNHRGSRDSSFDYKLIDGYVTEVGGASNLRVGINESEQDHTWIRVYEVNAGVPWSDSNTAHIKNLAPQFIKSVWTEATLSGKLHIMLQFDPTPASEEKTTTPIGKKRRLDVHQ